MNSVNLEIDIGGRPTHAIVTCGNDDRQLKIWTGGNNHKSHVQLWADATGLLDLDYINDAVEEAFRDKYEG